jgi:quercetin dioxygenase-like cupin family protein
VARRAGEVERPLCTAMFDIGGIDAPQSPKARTGRVVFEDPTAYLGKLHAHVTDLQPGAGYPAHEDKYDVAILVFSGTVETLGKRVGPGGSIYYAAGEPHGMRNAGDQPARYLVFEFHGPKRA